jgi:hypothetical protein
MIEFFKALFSKHVLIVSESYQIFRLKGDFYTQLLGNSEGAVRAFKYFIAVHHVLLMSLWSLGGAFKLNGGINLIKSELYVIAAVVAVLPNILAFRALAAIKQVRLSMFGAAEIVFYAASYLYILIILSIPIGVGMAMFFGLLYMLVGERFSFWHWAILGIAVYAIVIYVRYQLLWLRRKYGIPGTQSFIAMIIGFMIFAVPIFVGTLIK